MAYRKMEMLDAGELDQRVTLQSPVLNAGGDEVASYSDIATVWASVTPIRGNEKDLADRETSIQFRLVRIRYRAGLDTAKRIVHRGDVYDIDDAMNSHGSNRVIEFVCRVIQ